MMVLSSEERARYGRQMLLPEIGEEGQKKLGRADVFIAGIGGLGSVSAYYMAAAGIGALTLADMDLVGPENLNRQLLHGTHDIARPKTESAVEKLRELNPHCRVRALRDEIREDNAAELIGNPDIIMDATDNMTTRKVLNRVSVAKHIPFIYGGISGFDGMVSTFVPGQTPCFECLFPQRTVPGEKTSTLGPVAGLVASVQSLEAIKLILGVGTPLKGRLLRIRGLDMLFKETRLERNTECDICHSPSSDTRAFSR